MKLKYYLKGLGAGILFATIVLSISFAVYNNEREEKTRDDIIAAALAAGMVWPEKETTTERGSGESTTEESTPKESITEESTPSESTSEQDNTTSVPDVTTTEPTTPKETTTEESTPEETTPQETTPEETTTPQETTPEETTTPQETTRRKSIKECVIYKGADKAIIEIQRGMTSYDAAKILEEAGILKGYYDREAFNDYVIATGYSGQVMIGVFEIPAGSTYDDIIKIICRMQ